MGIYNLPKQIPENSTSVCILLGEEFSSFDSVIAQVEYIGELFDGMTCVGAIHQIDNVHIQA